ncbi:MAG: hypothetical protein ACODAU_09420 [Myxococcota bacterium]
MVTLHAGATLDRPPGPKYRADLHFAELSLAAPLPRPTTMARWRDEAGSSFRLSLVAPRPTMISARGPLRFDESLEDAVGWLWEVADALDVFAVVFPTGPEVTTGQRDRDRLAAYFDRFPRQGGRSLVWAPTGLWEPEMAVPQAQALGLVYGFDPLETPAPSGELAYGRLRAVGGRQRFGEGMLHDAYETMAASGADDAYVAIESGRSHREALALQRLASEMDAEAAEETAPEGG